MLVALILVSVALAITLGILLFNKPAEAGGSVQQQLQAESKARSSLEAELEKRRRDLEEQRAQLSEVKDQLKQAKRKLYDQKEADKDSQDLVKARAEVERSASLQLEHVRSELSSALTELERLRAERDGGRGRKPAPRPEPEPAAVAVAAPAPAITPVVAPTGAVAEAEKPKRYRELNDADRERMERLEHQSNKDRQKAAELEKEVKRLKGRLDGNNRIYTASKNELELLRDKYKALEKRLNRILLERDLMQRAIKDLEKKTGAVASRVELTADEIAASDRKVEESARVDAEIRAAAQAPAAGTDAAEATSESTAEGSAQGAASAAAPAPETSAESPDASAEVPAAEATQAVASGGESTEAPKPV